MLTLLHAADLHLDTPFRALPPQEAALRRREQRQVLDALRDLALERRVDLVLLAGDLFDSQQTYPETLELLSRTLGELPCPVCIAPGNHDYWSPDSPYALRSWPSNVHIFTQGAVTALPFPELGATVYGCAFTGPFREDDPLQNFTAPEDGLLHIGLFHGEVGKQSRYAPIDPERLTHSSLDYVALGHIHNARLEPNWAYPGCPQGRGFDELGDKGVCLVTLSPHTAPQVEFVPLPGPRYLWLTLPLDGAPPEESLAAALAGHGGDYVRLTLTGESESLDLPALRARLEPLCRMLDLRDETRPPAGDLWRRMEEENLTGFFLRELKSQLDRASEEDKPTILAALKYGIAALEGREKPQ